MGLKTLSNTTNGDAMTHLGAAAILSILVLLCPLAPAPAFADAAVAVGVIADDGVNPMFVANSFDPEKRLATF